MNIATLAGHLAFGLIAFSFLVKDILYLRVLSILASLFSVLYNFYIPVEPMWLAINWNIIFVLVNIYHIAVIIYEKRPVKMSPKEKELYEDLLREYDLLLLEKGTPYAFRNNFLKGIRLGINGGFQYDFE